MTSKGRVRFECLECHRKWLPRRREWIRAAGISCPDCGSRMWVESKESRTKRKLAKAPSAGISEDAKRTANRDTQTRSGIPR